MLRDGWLVWMGVVGGGLCEGTAACSGAGSTAGASLHPKPGVTGTYALVCLKVEHLLCTRGHTVALLILMLLHGVFCGVRWVTDLPAAAACGMLHSSSAVSAFLN